MNISIIIPTYNRADSLEQTLKILLKGNELPEEIILVDQTTEATVANRIKYLATLSPIIRLIHNDVASSTLARNTGIEAAKGDVLVFMDDDVDVSPSTLHDLRMHFSEDSQLVMIAGINKGEEYINKNSRFGLLFGRSSWRRKKMGHVTNAIYGRFPIQMKGSVETEWAMGFFFAVRRTIIDKYDLRFDENLQRYAYAEDLDFSYRLYNFAKSENLFCRMYPDIVVKHNATTEYRIPSRLAIFQVICHRRYLSHKLFNNALSSMACRWSDFGSLLTALLRRENWHDYLDAIKHAHKYSADIKNGNFHFDII